MLHIFFGSLQVFSSFYIFAVYYIFLHRATDNGSAARKRASWSRPTLTRCETTQLACSLPPTLQALQSDVDGVCKVHDIDMFEGKRIMVMQLLGENLSTLRKSVVETGMRLSWDSTRSLGQEMLKALHQVCDWGPAPPQTHSGPTCGASSFS